MRIACEALVLGVLHLGALGLGSTLLACGSDPSTGADASRGDGGAGDGGAGDTGVVPGPPGFRCAPATVTLSPGAAATQLRATATGRDGAEERLNDRPGLVWKSSDLMVLYVDAAGRASARALGAAMAWAEYEGGRSSPCAVTVQRPGSVRRIAVEPARLTLAPGDARPLVVQETAADGTITDVTAMAAWSSSSPVISTWNASMGKAVGLAMGSATLTATVGGATASTLVTVLRPLRRLDVEPAALSMQRHTARALRALGTYDDGTRVDATAFVAWSSEVRELVRVDASGEVRALAVTPGAVTLTAAAGWGLETPLIAQTAVTVRDDAPERLTLLTSPEGPLVTGAAAQLRALCMFADGSTSDVANATGVTHQSSSPGVVTVSATGALTPLRAGTARVTVAFRGVSAERELTVVGAP